MTDRYTHGHHESVLRSHRWRTAENSAGFVLAHLVPGTSLLDVGCGPGTITVDLARRVEPGLVVGIDREPAVVAAATASYPPAAHPNLRFVTADVYGLDLDDESFDVVFAHQVLQHLTDPVAALREMRRVCRRDGVVAVRDSDYPAMTWHPAEPALDRWLALYCLVARSNGGEPAAGRHLTSWARMAGFRRVTSSASAWCFAVETDRRWWGETWAERVVSSALAERAVGIGAATRDELADIARGWLRWAADPDGWFGVLHSEVLCRP